MVPSSTLREAQKFGPHSRSSRQTPIPKMTSKKEPVRTAMTIAGVKKTADADERLRRLISVHES
jgi:hypothetical protein